ncbi:hypothetical protein D3C75_1170650 [compost metagenome]
MKHGRHIIPEPLYIGVFRQFAGLNALPDALNDALYPLPAVTGQPCHDLFVITAIVGQRQDHHAAVRPIVTGVGFDRVHQQLPDSLAGIRL